MIIWELNEQFNRAELMTFYLFNVTLDFKSFEQLTNPTNPTTDNWPIASAARQLFAQCANNHWKSIQVTAQTSHGKYIWTQEIASLRSKRLRTYVQHEDVARSWLLQIPPRDLDADYRSAFSIDTQMIISASMGTKGWIRRVVLQQDLYRQCKIRLEMMFRVERRKINVV